MHNNAKTEDTKTADRPQKKSFFASTLLCYSHQNLNYLASPQLASPHTTPSQTPSQLIFFPRFYSSLFRRQDSQVHHARRLSTHLLNDPSERLVTTTSNRLVTAFSTHLVTATYTQLATPSSNQRLASLPPLRPPFCYCSFDSTRTSSTSLPIAPSAQLVTTSSNHRLTSLPPLRPILLLLPRLDSYAFN